MTWWTDETYSYFVNKDMKGWDEEYIREVLATPPEKNQGRGTHWKRHLGLLPEQGSK